MMTTTFEDFLPSYTFILSLSHTHCRQTLCLPTEKRARESTARLLLLLLTTTIAIILEVEEEDPTLTGSCERKSHECADNPKGEETRMSLSCHRERQLVLMFPSIRRRLTLWTESRYNQFCSKSKPSRPIFHRLLSFTYAHNTLEE